MISKSLTFLKSSLITLLMLTPQYGLALTCADNFSTGQTSTDSAVAIVNVQGDQLPTVPGEVTPIRHEISFADEPIANFVNQYAETIEQLSVEQKKAVENLFGENGPLGNLSFIYIVRYHIKQLETGSEEEKELWKEFNYYFLEKGVLPDQIFNRLIDYLLSSILYIYSADKETDLLERAGKHNIGKSLALKRNKTIADFRNTFSDPQQADQLLKDTLTLNVLQLGLIGTYSKEQGDISKLIYDNTKAEDMKNPLAYLTSSEEFGEDTITSPLSSAFLMGFVGGGGSWSALYLVDFLTGIPLATLTSALISGGLLGGLGIWADQLESKNSITRLILQKKLLGLAQTRASLSAEIAKSFVRSGKVELIVGPDTNKHDGKFNPPQLESKNQVSFEEFKSKFEDADQENKLLITAELQQIFSANLVAASSGFNFTDKDFSKVIEAFSQIKSTKKGLFIPRRLRGSTKQQKAYVLLASQARYILGSVERVRDITQQIQLIVNYLNESTNLPQELEATIKFFEQILSQKEFQLTSYESYANELNEIAENILINKWDKAKALGDRRKNNTTGSPLPEQVSTDQLLGQTSNLPALPATVGGDNLPTVVATTTDLISTNTWANDYQRQAYELVKNDSRFEKFKERLLEINNEHQIDVIKLIIDNQWPLQPYMEHISAISNNHHLEYIRAYAIKYRTFPSYINLDLPIIQNEHQLNVMLGLVASRMSMTSQIRMILRLVENPHQAALLKIYFDKRKDISEIGNFISKVQSEENVTVFSIMMEMTGLRNRDSSFERALNIQTKSRIDALRSLSEYHPYNKDDYIILITQLEMTVQLKALTLIIESGGIDTRDFFALKDVLELIEQDYLLDAVERFLQFPGAFMELMGYLPKLTSQSIVSSIPAYGLKDDWYIDDKIKVPRQKEDGIKGWKSTRLKATRKYLQSL